MSRLDHSHAPSGARADRHGPLRPGDLVQLTDSKGRHHTIALTPGKQFHTHKGALNHDDIIGGPEGVVISATSGMPYLVLRPLLSDFVLSMPRGAAVVYPKDAAVIVGLADLFPGARVLEAGAGSGALTCSLLRAVGQDGQVISFERRPEFAEVARGNVERFFGGPHPAWQLVVGDFSDPGVPQLLAQTGPAGPDGSADAGESVEPDPGAGGPVESPAPQEAGSPAVHRVILDMLAPWDCVGTAASVLAPGGILVAYVATTTQLSRMAETLRVDGRWTEPAAQETLLRTWHLEGLAVRPDHRMIGHTGFLLVARRLADGTVLPARRTRPAPGAYGADYVGPRPAGQQPPAGEDVQSAGDPASPAAEQTPPE